MDKTKVKNQKLKSKIQDSSEKKPKFEGKNNTKQNNFKKKKKSFTEKKNTKTIIDYFPRDSNDHSDFTYNVATIDKKGKKEFLSKKRKNNVKSDEMDDDLGGLSKIKFDNKVQEEPGQISRLKFPKFEIGDLVLLSISEIHKDYMIANYTRNIKAMIHMNYTGIEKEKLKLTKLFKIGQFICGTVVSPGNDIQLSSGKLNKKILVSIDPKITNIGLEIDSIKEGMDIWGRLNYNLNTKAYSVDFQISNSNKIEDFIQKDLNDEEEEVEEEEEVQNEEDEEEEDEDKEIDDEEENEENLQEYVEKKAQQKLNKKQKNKTSEYQVVLEENDNIEFMKNYNHKGLYFFKVVAIEIKENDVKIIHVSLDQEKHKKPLRLVDFSLLKPGFLFKSSITRDLQNGVEVAYGGNLGGIFIDHLRKGKGFLSRIIHIGKNHTVALSNKSNIVNLETKDILNKQAQVGSLYENILVKELLFGNSFELRINDKKAFLHKINIDSNQILKQNDIIPKIRVKEYNFFDDRPILTAKSSEIDKNIYTWENICIGQILEGTITNLTKEDIYIRINHFIFGKLNKNQITDFPLNSIPKKFNINTKIKVKILSFNYETKNLVFTSKETLMEANLNPDIKQLKEGEEIYVTYKGNNIYHYCGEINGKVINKIKESDLKVGKLFLFKIYKINPEKNKIVLTNSTTVWIPGIGDFDSHIRRNPILALTQKLLNKQILDKLNEGNNNINESLNNLIGTINEFKIIKPKNLLKLLLKQSADSNILNENLDAITQKFLIVRMISTDVEIYGFCPMEIVSDFHQEKTFAKYIKTSVNLKMLVLHFDPYTMSLFVTSKSSLMKFSVENKIPKEKEQLQPDHIYAGYVNKIQEKKGIVLQFLGKLKSFVKFPKNMEHFYAGQTILARYTQKEKFNLVVYKGYSSSEIIDESSVYFNQYLENLLYLTSNLIQKDLIRVEGKIFQITQDGVLITLENESKFIGSLRKDHMICNEKILNEESKIEDEYKIGDKKQFDVVDIDYINGIIFLTDRINKINKSPNVEDYFNKNTNTVCEVKIDLINEHHISVSLNDNPLVKGILLCNLYNFNFESSHIYDIIKINDTIKVKLSKYNKELNKLIFEFPSKFIKKIIDKESKQTSSDISLGGLITGIVNGIKGDYIYLYVNKKTIAKINFSNYNGDSNVLKEKYENKTEVSTSKEDKTVITGKIVQISEKKGKTVLDVTTNYSNDDLHNRDFLFKNNVDYSGLVENTGIISKIDLYSKNPIQIDISTNKRVKIHFSKIPVDSISIIKDKFKIGDKITYFARKSNENDVEKIDYSLTKFKDDLEEPKVNDLVSLRVLKRINGKGLVVELPNSKSGFIDICEVTDEIHPNPLEKFAIGFITLGRILGINEDLSHNQYLISLRDSVVIDSLFNIIINGSSIQFLNKFNDFEKHCDFRNKIMKLKAVNTIEQNLVCVGYVVNSSEKGVFIKISRDTTVRAGLRELTDEKTTKPFLLYKPEQLVILRVLSFFKNTEKIEKINVSLRESVVKYNLTLKLKDLSVNSFYECLIMNEQDGRYQVNIVGSTFTGYIKDKNINQNTKLHFTLKNIVILQLLKMDKNIHPPKLRFSNSIIDNYVMFDKTMVVNSCNDEKEAERRKTYLEIYENIKMINENYAQNKVKNEFKDLEKKMENIDFENLIEEEVKYGKDEEHDEEEIEDEDENENVLEDDQDENEDIIVKIV